MLFRNLDHQVKLPYKFMFAYSEVAKRAPGAAAYDVILEVYLALYGIELSQEQAVEVAERLSAWASQADKKSQPAPSPGLPQKSNVKNLGNTNTFGYRYRQWFSSLGLDQALLWLSDYDPERAEYFYSQVDKDLVDMALETKTKAVEELNRISFEAALFGNGGSYGKGKKGVPEGNVIEHDCTKLSGSEIEARLKALQQRR